MKRFVITKLMLFILMGFLIGIAYSWTPLAVKEDQKMFMPGSQPGSASLESANRCDNCHGGYNLAVEPAHNWRGSMMAHAARDPLWLACLTVAGQDSVWQLGNPNAQDLCIRCHTPTGWLGGRSDPTNTSALTGSDFEGVNCDSCHRMVDPFNARRQMPELAAETNASAIAEADKTYQRDAEMLAPLSLFDGSPFFNSSTGLPFYYGTGSLPDYIEATSGQYFIDSTNAKRGSRYDAAPKHQWYYSRFHKTKYACAACHDVSNPALANVLIGAGVPERQAAASYFHVERTFSEFMLSAYGQTGGAPTNAKIGVGYAAKCQDCHMRDVTGKSANKSGILTRTDLALHDMTGGNAWMLGVLASADQSGTVFDPYNYAILSGTKYAGAKIDVSGLQAYSKALLDGRSRALQQLAMAADLIPVSETSSSVVLRIQNNSGHKLISGFPEGRRMWLNLKFYDASDSLIGEINPYEPLVISRDSNGNAHYVSGAILHKWRDDLVYEAETSSTLTGEEKTFHFVLATNRHKDNRIPPKGFRIAQADARLSIPRWEGADTPDYFTSAEYLGGYDEVSVTKPTGTARWTASLYYQSTSKEYVQFLRDEIAGSATSLWSPTPSGQSSAYIIQTDPFFANLKGWGNAIWDLWLHNGGSPPVLMATLGTSAPCAAPNTPANLTATPSKRKITLEWSAVSEATGYSIYYSQGGKYAFKESVTSTSFVDGSLKPGQTYCYAVTSYSTCPDSSTAESGYSAVVCAVPTR